MPSIIKSTFATILYILIIELTAFWILIPEKLGFESYHNYYILVQGLFQLVVVVIFTRLIKQNKTKKYCNSVKAKWYLIAAISGCLFVVYQSPLTWIYNFIFGTEHYIKYDFDGLIEFKNINILSTILFIPIAEELFFRGFIQEYLQKKLKIWSAIIVASIMFAIIHAPYLDLVWSEYNPEWHSFYLTFFGGLISGIMYFKSKSILPSITFHIFWNIMATIV